ncbi:polysaccharide pyruvyl transferase family protein [Pseudactinotalea terrae]|uniref:polysaccharide pyruvyl transferase family protein n=1 Tax=Pseudactinotalea terrae TaxID=1743262 RepID=UPI0013912C3E|nr:polysaccharide pyruvyl transferase family protein [Pseudactinotalea terrae]
MSHASTRTVLLRSSWANVNIGDVAHSPGLITALLGAAPQARIILWAQRLGEREEAMLRRANPTIEIVRGDIDDDGVPNTPELLAAWDDADVLVHGSGAGAFRDDLMLAWRARTGRPYGYAGVTVDPLCPPAWGPLDQLRTMTRDLPPTYLEPRTRETLAGAEFIFARDSITLEFLRAQGVTAGSLEFGPDGTFAYTHRDDAAADAFVAELDLTAGAFGCFVPRLRYTPYPDIYGTARTREFDRRYAINAGTVGPDLDALAAGIAAWVRATGQPAVVVPEMSYAVELAQRELAPRLPADVVEQVLVLGRYWPLEEANAVYARARAVVSMECHSPILASVHGTPTLYLRQPTDTIKGEMYADLGAGDAVVEIERDGAAGTAAAVERLLADEEGARASSRALNRTAVDRLHAVAATVLTGEPPRPYPLASEDLAGVAAR